MRARAKKKGNQARIKEFPDSVSVREAIRKGNAPVRLSCLVMGAGNLRYGQYVKGILFLAANPILRLFLSDAGLIGAGVVMLRWQVSTSILAAFVQLFTIYFQSTGHMMGSFLLSVSRQGVVFVLALLIGAALFGYTGIIAAQAAADAVSFLAAAVLFRAQLWKELV